VQALQAQPQSSAELATQFGVSDRHIRRTVAHLILEGKVTRERNGRDFIYSIAAAVVEEDATTTITAPAGTADNCGHNVRDRDLGHSPDNDGAISDNCGHDRGHADLKTTKQRHRIAKRTAISHGPARIGRDWEPGFGFPQACEDSGTNLCPQLFAGFERDQIQFVLVDRVFRDLALSKSEKWSVRRTHNGNQVWLYPIPALSLQIGLKDTVVFRSSEPGDMSAIAAWIRDAFPEYGDMDGLVARIKHPQSLIGEELTVVIKHEPTIAAIRPMIEKDRVNGEFNLRRPGTATPGLKIYEFNGTMRVEFLVSDYKTAVNAIDMREELMRLMPRIHRTPGLFWEFIQKHYSALHHPIIIDTGGHEFLQALDRVTGIFQTAIETIAARSAPAQQDLQLRELRDAIEALESSELGDIIRTFRDLLNVEEAPTKVFLAAWTIWKGRHCKGRVNKAEIASLLLRQNDPLPVADIAEALPVLRTAGLLQEDPKIEICFSAAGREIAEILMAKREGL
jgi:hypothetical protein